MAHETAVSSGAGSEARYAVVDRFKLGKYGTIAKTIDIRVTYTHRDVTKNTPLPINRRHPQKYVRRRVDSSSSGP